MIGGLILAAGSGSRFGGRKQLAELDGRPLISHAIEAMAAVPAIERIVVVLGAAADEIEAEVRLAPAEVVRAEGWREGIAASLRSGVAALSECDAIVITLADQPLISAQVIAAVVDLEDGPAPAARATYDGRAGHPVLIKRELFNSVLELRGDEGARDLLEAAGATRIECGRLASPRDVDSTADLAAIAAGRARAGQGAQR